MAKETKTAGVLTIHDEEQRMQVNEQRRYDVKRTGPLSYEMWEVAEPQVKIERNPLPEEKCLDLTEKGKHGKIYANGYGVTLRLYIRHTEYDTPFDLGQMILREVGELCRQLLEKKAAKIIKQLKQIWL